jgi:tRNA (cytidine/uridine-2'-O-)-methyltransferase
MKVWETWEECRASLADRRWFATTTHPPHRRYDEIEYRAGDVVAFGCESTGLGDALLNEFPDEHRLHIPMRPSNRSINLANSVSVVAYEAWRQQGFAGAAIEPFDESLRPTNG